MKSTYPSQLTTKLQSSTTDRIKSWMATGAEQFVESRQGTLRLARRWKLSPAIITLLALVGLFHQAVLAADSDAVYRVQLYVKVTDTDGAGTDDPV